MTSFFLLRSFSITYYISLLFRSTELSILWDNNSSFYETVIPSRTCAFIKTRRTDGVDGDDIRNRNPERDLGGFAFISFLFVLLPKNTVDPRQGGFVNWKKRWNNLRSWYFTVKHLYTVPTQKNVQNRKQFLWNVFWLKIQAERWTVAKCVSSQITIYVQH